MTSSTQGRLALFGSGEYLPEMADIEKSLFENRPNRYVQIPTASTGEGPARTKYWVDLGVAQAERLGVQAVPLVISTRDQANDQTFVDQLQGAGVIYLSGGNPKLLIDTLSGTAVAAEILRQFEAGCTIAGCSAGAMALSAWIPSLRGILHHESPGLGLAANLAVLPHFDRFMKRIPPPITSFLMRRPPNIELIGVDEETGIIGGGNSYEVKGRGSAWHIAEGKMTEYPSGSQLELER